MNPTNEEVDSLMDELDDEDYYVYTPINGIWFDGYDYQSVVIINNAQDAEPRLLKELVGRLPVRVQTKGGTRELRATDIYLIYRVANI